VLVLIKVCRSAHFHLRALRHNRAALTDDMAKTVAVSLIHSRIDYRMLTFIHGFINVRRLQCVQNSAARVVLRDRPHQSTTALLSELHWLPAQSRITFMIACLTYIHCSALLPSRVDYCNCLLAGAKKASLDKLQRVMNAAARVLILTLTSSTVG